MLNTRFNQLGSSRSQLDKASFVEQLCVVWHEGLKPTNIVSGFNSTGIFLLDRMKYPENRLVVSTKTFEIVRVRIKKSLKEIFFK